MLVNNKTQRCVTQCQNLCLILLLVCLFFSVEQAKAVEKELEFLNTDTTAHLYFASTQRVLGANLRERLHRKLQDQIKIKESFDEIPFSNDDLKQAVIIFDQILQEHIISSNKWIAANKKAIHQALITEFESKIRLVRTNDSSIQEESYLNFVRDREFQDWLQKYSAFIAEAIPLAIYAEVIYILSPSKAIYKVQSIDQQKEFREMIDNEFASFSAINFLGLSTLNSNLFIHEALRSDSLRSYMPVRFNLEKLHQQEKDLRAEAKTIFSDPDAVKYANFTGRIVSESTSGFRKEIDHNPAEQVQEALRGLAKRVYYAVYSKLPDGCERIGQWYDEDSIRSSNGDWRKVKRKDGRTINPNGMIDEIGVSVMQPLSVAYTHGCFSEKNPVAAKQVMEDWANEHGDKGRIAAITHCTLVEWERYGIGGDKNESAAQAWETRFIRETGAANGCMSNLPPIDPSSPWRILN